LTRPTRKYGKLKKIRELTNNWSWVFLEIDQGVWVPLLGGVLEKKGPLCTVVERKNIIRKREGRAGNSDRNTLRHDVAHSNTKLALSERELAD